MVGLISCCTFFCHFMLSALLLLYHVHDIETPNSKLYSIQIYFWQSIPSKFSIASQCSEFLDHFLCIEIVRWPSLFVRWTNSAILMAVSVSSIFHHIFLLCIWQTSCGTLTVSSLQRNWSINLCGRTQNALQVDLIWIVLVLFEPIFDTLASSTIIKVRNFWTHTHRPRRDWPRLDSAHAQLIRRFLFVAEWKKKMPFQSAESNQNPSLHTRFHSGTHNTIWTAAAVAVASEHISEIHTSASQPSASSSATISYTSNINVHRNE